MAGRREFVPLNSRAWLLNIGQHLRAEYDALAEPVPPRLAALVKQLEASIHDRPEESAGSVDSAEDREQAQRRASRRAIG